MNSGDIDSAKMGTRIALLGFAMAFISDFAVNGGLGGPPPCISWERKWYNDSHPGKQTYFNEIEALPAQAVLDKICSPSQGALVIRCTSDPFGYSFFEGRQWSDDYKLTCNLTNGLECVADQLDCPDHKIGFGCDICQASTISPQTNPSITCPTQTGSPIAASPSNNCSCQGQAQQQQGQSSATVPGVTNLTIVLIIFLLFLCQ